MAVSCIPFTFPGLENVRCAFQTRELGASTAPYDKGNIGTNVEDNPQAIEKNREDLRTALQVKHLVCVNQVHGKEMVFDPTADALPVAADGVAVSQPNIGALITTADCQPLMIAHQSGRCVAGLHVGWQGNRINFPAEGVRLFCEHYAVAPEELFAVRGPSLGPSCAEFINFDTEWGADFAAWFTERDKTMNLWKLTRDQLLEAGLRPERLFALDLCTYTMNDSFFSVRRQKVTGRQGSVIWMTR